MENGVNTENQMDENMETKEDESKDQEKEQLQQIRAILSYYQDAKHFATQMNQCCAIICELLTSSLKTEVVSAMKFFVTAYRFELEGCEVGIKKMVHKIWEKDIGDKEGASIRDVLLNCFQELHFDTTSEQENSDFKTAENLIKFEFLIIGW